MANERNNVRTPALPNKIHFIWIGGPIPTHYLENILKLTGELEGKVEINLWTDKNPDASNFFDKNWKDPGFIKQPNLKIRHINEIFEEIKHQEKSFMFDKISKDIPSNKGESQNTIEKNSEIDLANKKEKSIFDRSYYEVAKLICSLDSIGAKNYAQVTDLLRLLILTVEGGLYLDCDTTFEFSAKKNQEVKEFVELRPPYGFYGNFGWNFSMSGYRGLYTEEWDAVLGNDIIAMMPNHEIGEYALKEMILDFAKLLASWTQQEKSNLFTLSNLDKKRHDPTDRLIKTIDLGPGIMSRAVNHYRIEHGLTQNQPYDLVAPRRVVERTKNRTNITCELFGVKMHSQSDQNWVTKKWEIIKEPSSEEELKNELGISNNLKEMIEKFDIKNKRKRAEFILNVEDIIKKTSYKGNFRDLLEAIKKGEEDERSQLLLRRMNLIPIKESKKSQQQDDTMLGIKMKDNIWLKLNISDEEIVSLEIDAKLKRKPTFSRNELHLLNFKPNKKYSEKDVYGIFFDKNGMVIDAGRKINPFDKPSISNKNKYEKLSMMTQSSSYNPGYDSFYNNFLKDKYKLAKEESASLNVESLADESQYVKKEATAYSEKIEKLKIAICNSVNTIEQFKIRQAEIKEEISKCDQKSKEIRTKWGKQLLQQEKLLLLTEEHDKLYQKYFKINRQIESNEKLIISKMSRIAVMGGEFKDYADYYELEDISKHLSLFNKIDNALDQSKKGGQNKLKTPK